MKMVVALISSLLVAAPAVAQGGSGSVSGSAGELSTQGDTPESTGQGGQGADGERRICRRVETGSQSRMTYRRVCRTAEEWRESQRGQ
ncbi:MAG TPA: hypothetical protein VMG08_09275 [Allosphingosinicella sp.]|nr:hypothetical protein [Allosphingosinicella sp.]